MTAAGTPLPVTTPVVMTTADREIVISRFISVRGELVFEVFTEVRHLSQGWRPERFTTTARASRRGADRA